MSVKEFVLKGMINLLFWVLTFMVLGFGAPLIVRLFAPGAVVRSFDFESLADVRLMVAQVAAVGLAVFLLRMIQPAAAAPAASSAAAPAPAAASPAPGAAPMPSIPKLFAEEAFTAAMNFGAICACIVIFLKDPLFLVGVAINYAIAFRIR